MSKHKGKTKENKNLFQIEEDEGSVVYGRKDTKRYHSVFVRIITTFFLLSVIPIAISATLTVAIYQSSVRQFLPAANIAQVEQVLLAQNVLILLLVVILVIFAGSIISSSVICPLKRLVKLSHMVGQGKLGYRLTATTTDEVGELTDAFNTMIDELTVQRQREQLVSKMKSEFISIAAHQLRTPLSAVKWTMKMLTEGDLGKLTNEQRDFLLRGYQVNERMISLVGDLLNVARIEEGRFGYRYELIDFTQYLKNYVERYRHQAAASGISLHLLLSHQPAPKLLLDTQKMNLVLQNLLDNAIKYSKPGGTVTINAMPLKNEIRVVIGDTGVGIPKHQIHRLFTKFFRADNVIRMQTQGSGLGLFIVKNIIQNHGGDIHAESVENKGTKMIFTLPYSKKAIPEKEITFEEFVSNL